MLLFYSNSSKALRDKKTGFQRFVTCVLVSFRMGLGVGDGPMTMQIYLSRAREKELGKIAHDMQVTSVFG